MATLGSKTLAAFVAANKHTPRLTGHIERFLLTRPPSDRPTDVLHPSEMSHPDWCILDNYHRMVGTVLSAEDQPAPPGMQLESIFAEGHTIHRKWQSWVRSMGNLYGIYACRDCAHTWWATSPQLCAKCHSIHVEYAEVPLISDPKYRISGHADGWVVGIGKPFMIELKSIGIGTFRAEDPKFLMDNDGDLDKAWKSLRRPFPSHRRQGQIYLTLLHQMAARGDLEPGVEVPDEMVFLYELKSNQSFKEFTMSWNAEMVADRFDLALDVDWAIQTKTPPHCNIGPGCKKCAPYAAVA